MINLFIYNFLISSLLFLVYLIRGIKGRVIRLIIMILMPIVGIVMFLLLDISIKYFIKNKKNSLHEEGGSNFTSLLLRKFEIDNWEDIIPIEDALVLNNEKVRRKLIFNTLKDDTYTHLNFLKKALNDEDTEASHYAAISIMEIKRKLTVNIQQLKEKYESGNRNNSSINESYAEALKKYIQSGLLDDKAYKEYMNIYSKVLKDISNNKNVKEIYYQDKIGCDISMKKYDEAIEVCKRYRCQFPKSDKPFISLLKIYFFKKDKRKFDEVIKELMGADIRIEKESLEIVRFWLRGVY